MEKTIKIVEGWLEWVEPMWDDDPPARYEIDRWGINTYLKYFNNSYVRITIEKIDEPKE